MSFNTLSQLQDFKTSYKKEKVDVKETIKFIKNNHECFENTHKKGHITGAAFILDNNLDHTLLTHHAKLNRWFQPGGHSDGNHDTKSVALREAEEETGLKTLEFINEGIFDVDIHTIPTNHKMPEHKHYDIRFLLKADISEKYIVTHESHDLKWVKLAEVKNYSDDKALLRMVEKAQKLNL